MVVIAKHEQDMRVLRPAQAFRGRRYDTDHFAIQKIANLRRLRRGGQGRAVDGDSAEAVAARVLKFLNSERSPAAEAGA